MAFRYGSSSTRFTVGVTQLGLIIGQLRLYAARSSLDEEGRIRQCNTWNRVAIAHLIMVSYLGNWVHEAGHAVAMKLCWLGVKPEIEIEFFAGGRTYPMEAEEPTRFAFWLGEGRVQLLIDGAGVFASTTSALLTTSAAWAFRSKLLEYLALWQTAREVIHAFQNGRDFVAIRANGGPSRSVIAVGLVIHLLTSLFFSLNRP